MERFTFDEVFEVKSDGSIAPRRKIRISGITLGPGVVFGGGVSIGGVDLQRFKGSDIAAEKVGTGDDEVLVMQGFFRS